MLGYVAIGIPCGILSASIGLNALQVFLMCALFYSGAGQFMIPNMWLAGSPIASIIASVSFVNTRQMLRESFKATFVLVCRYSHRRELRCEHQTIRARGLVCSACNARKPLLAILLDDFVCYRSAHRECNWHSACDSLICHDFDFHLPPRNAKTLRSKCCCSHHGNRRCFCLQAHRPFRTRNLLRGPVWSSLRIRLLSNTGKGVMHAANNVDRFLDHLRHMCIDDSCMPRLAALPS